MIFRSPYPDVAIPEVSLTRFVLERAAELGKQPALIEGPTGRVISYANLAEAIKRAAAGLAQPVSRRAKYSESTARTCLSMQSPSMPSLRWAE